MRHEPEIARSENCCAERKGKAAAGDQLAGAQVEAIIYMGRGQGWGIGVAASIIGHESSKII